MKEKLTLNDLLTIVLKHIWVVIVLLIVGAGAAMFLKPSESVTHSAMAQVMISPKARFDISSTTISDLVKTKKVLGVSINRYNKTVNDEQSKVKYSDLYDTLQVQMNGNSRLVTITSEADSTKDAKRLVNEIAERTKTVANTDLPAWKSVVVTKATILDKAAEGFSKKKALALGGGVGLFLGLAMTFVLEAVEVSNKKKQVK